LPRTASSSQIPVRTPSLLRGISISAVENQFAVSGALASMATGLPYAIAAGIADKSRPVYAVVGDGGLGMQLGEFSTAVRYGIPLKLLVICNGMLNQIAWEQMMFLGNPQFACELAPIDFAKAAEAMGGHGFTIREFSEIDTVLDEAFSTDGPGHHSGSGRQIRAHDAAENAARLQEELRESSSRNAGKREDRSQRQPFAASGNDGCGR
jgi:TPP-dependent 2-oxoacid decarboxylase